MLASRSFSLRFAGIAATLCAVQGCAEADTGPDLFPQVVEAGADQACLCMPTQLAACDCPNGGQGVKTCLADCVSYGECTQCPDAGADADASKAGAGGSAGTGGSSGKGGTAGTAGTAGKGGTAGGGGTGGTAGTAGSGGTAGTAGTAGSGGAGGTAGSAGKAGSGGAAGTGGTAGAGGTGACSTPGDQCPGAVIVLSGTGDDPRTGSATGTTVGKCSDYTSLECSSGLGPDQVYSVTPDVDGRMTLQISNATFDPLLYLQLNCGDPTMEVGCATSPSPLVLDVSANATYYVVVDGASATEAGTYTLNVTIKPPSCGDNIVQSGEECDDGGTADGDGCSHDCKLEPAGPNDTCPGVAIVLTGTGTAPRVGTVSGTTQNANPDYTGSCGSTFASGNDVVYSFQSDVTGNATIDLGGATKTPFDAVVYARTDCLTTTSELACDDNYGVGADTITFPVTTGGTYYVILAGYSDSDYGPFQINVSIIQPACGNTIVEPPEECDDGNTLSGDGCSATCVAEAVGGPQDVCTPGVELTLTQSGFDLVATASGSTATLAGNYAGTCAFGGSANDAVYRFNSGLGGKARVELTAGTTDFDSVLYVRSTDCNTGTEIDCADGSGQGGEVLQFDAAPNTEYWVFVDGYSGQSGAYELTIRVTPPICGNGNTEGSEECDDMNTAANDGCDPTCHWEGSCGTLAAIASTSTNPQIIPPECKSFKIPTLSLPLGEARYFQFALAGGASVRAWTFDGVPGQCQDAPDTVISLWKAPITVSTNTSGDCADDGYVASQCNDEDNTTPNSPCSMIGPYVVSNPLAGNYIVKVHNYSDYSAIPDFGVLVLVQ